jgi:hypothetical protein
VLHFNHFYVQLYFANEQELEFKAVIAGCPQNTELQDACASMKSNGGYGSRAEIDAGWRLRFPKLNDVKD